MVEPINMLHQQIGLIHFVGIGGVGMSGIAEVLVNLGYQVQGSDAIDNSTVQRLRKIGVKIFIGHEADNVRGCSVVVVSSAIPEDNAEAREARRWRIPVLKRAEMLAELMRFRFGIAIAGTHGKTTTTSLIAALLSEAGLDPTYVVGGRVEHLGSSAGLGQSRYLVVEADESDASFLHLDPVMAVVTNVDNDHLAAYGGDFERLKQAFQDFLANLPFYGTAIVCRDDPVLRDFSLVVPRRFVTYGFDEGSDIRAFDVRFEGMSSLFKVVVPWSDAVLELKLKLPGRHNVLNTLAALAVCHELSVDEHVVRDALARFEGIGRRLQIHGEICAGNGSALVVDDYGHHPTEIAATLEAARTAWPGRRTVLIFQPHRYTRTRQLFDDFVAVLSGTDCLVLLDVYPAGEAPIEGADTRALCDAIAESGAAEPLYADALANVPAMVAEVVAPGDIVLAMGAGSVGTLAPLLLKELNRHDAA